ncbi:retrovirus-related pol polyprotein from transposon TNT 1-94 [Tanacetum coccineum]
MFNRTDVYKNEGCSFALLRSHSSLQVVKPNMRLHSAAAPYPSYNMTSIRIPKPSFSSNQNLIILNAQRNNKKAILSNKGNVTTVGPKAVVSEKREMRLMLLRPQHVRQIQVYGGLGPQESLILLLFVQGNPQLELQEKGVIDSGCSRHMTGNKFYLLDYKEINGGFVAFGGDPKGGKITGKGKISTDTECVVLSPDFKLLDENHVLLRVPRKDNMYSVDLKNIVPLGGLTCLFAKVTLDADKTMLVDSKLPTTFWAKAVNTACYVQNKVLIIKQ